jgi:hypothetical protein
LLESSAVGDQILLCELNRFAGNGIFSKEEVLDNLELQHAVFEQTHCSRSCTLFCMSREHNAKFFSLFEAKNLNVYPIVCCYQILDIPFTDHMTVGCGTAIMCVNLFSICSLVKLRS